MIGNDWDLALEDEFEKDYFLRVMDFVDSEYETKTIYPPYDEIFNAFKFTPLSNVKVVILGQDPYHEAGQAQKHIQGDKFRIRLSHSRIRLS